MTPRLQPSEGGVLYIGCCAHIEGAAEASHSKESARVWPDSTVVGRVITQNVSECLATHGSAGGSAGDSVGGSASGRRGRAESRQCFQGTSLPISAALKSNKSILVPYLKYLIARHAGLSAPPL